MQVRMRQGRWTIVAAGTVAVVLAVIAGTYWYTVEPAPAVKVRWRADVTDVHRQSLERRYRLVDPIASEGRTVTYNLLDTSTGNLEAIVGDPAVEDTGDIDRQRFAVAPDVPYGTRWMWVGDRLPVLRTPAVVPALVAAGALALGAIAVREVRRRRS